MFENGDIKDYGKTEDGKTIDWWKNEELEDLIKNNYLIEEGKKYGIKLISGLVTRYGNTYQAISAKVNPLSPYLLFGIKYDYYDKMWENFRAAPRSRKEKLSEIAFINYYEVSNEIKTEAKANLKEIYQLVKDIIGTNQWPEQLYIRDELVKILNARLEGMKVILGPDLDEIGELFERFLGDLTGIDKDRNHLLYKVCFNDVRSNTISFSIGQLIIRKQTIEQWDKSILDMFKSYTPEPNGDRVDRLLVASGIDENTKFSDNYEDSPTEDDLKLIEILKSLLINIFGRYTYESMMIGSIFVKDGNARFVRHPWQTFSRTARVNGLTFVHTDIPLTSLKKMEKRGSLFRAESILLDMFTLGLQRKVQTGSDPEINFKTFDMPTIPMEKWMPNYRENTEVKPDDLETFYELLSYDAARQVGIGIESKNIEKWNPRASGNMKLFNALYKLFEEKIKKKEGITENEKAMYKLMVLESVNFFIFASLSSKDSNLRVKLREFLQSEGKKGFTFYIKVKKGFPDNLKEIEFDISIFNGFFKAYYGGSQIQEMINSLQPATINYRPAFPEKGRLSPKPGVIEYYTENILRAQREEITNFGNWLKNLAKGRRIEIRPFNTFGKGFAYAKRSYMSFYPDSDNPRTGDQRFILDGRSDKDLNRFKDDYKKVLGGLLVDHQTFVISEIDKDGNVVRHLCAFNLLQGALDLDIKSELGTYISWVDADKYQYGIAPIVESFDSTLYNNKDPDSIINIMKAFQENDKLIGYQRVGTGSERKKELLIWMEICSKLPYIEGIFNI